MPFQQSTMIFFRGFHFMTPHIIIPIFTFSNLSPLFHLDAEFFVASTLLTNCFSLL
jgi:hypothetical protein